VCCVFRYFCDFLSGCCDLLLGYVLGRMVLFNFGEIRLIIIVIIRSKATFKKIKNGRRVPH